MENIINLPSSFINALYELLSDETKLQTIENRLKVTGMTFESNNFQISIQNNKELKELLSKLKELTESHFELA
jgi:cell shape-determining protein MreC